MHACFPPAKAAILHWSVCSRLLTRSGWKALKVRSVSLTGLRTLLQMVHPVAEIAEAKEGNVQPKTDDFRDLVSSSQSWYSMAV